MKHLPLVMDDKKRGSRLIDLTGKRFGRLVVISRSGSLAYGACRKPTWNCLCDCGTQCIKLGEFLRTKHTSSCGCFTGGDGVARKHGLAFGGKPSAELTMFYSARNRARDTGVEFSISAKDIRIPDECPLFGIKLVKGVGKLSRCSPTLDRIVNSKGYTPDNVWVISYAANRSKSDASISELSMMVDVLGRKIKSIK